MYRLGVVMLLVAAMYQPELCSAQPPPPPPPPPPMIPTCPSGWVWGFRLEKCLKGSSSLATWKQAAYDCIDLGGKLAQLTTPEHVWEALLLTAVRGEAWIGIHAVYGCDDFQTMDGVAVPASSPMWKAGEPNDCSSGKVTCVTAENSLISDTTACYSDEKNYICEKSL